MERLYPYDEAMTYIRNNGDYYKLYIAGMEYKGIALILNGATVQEYMNYVSNLNSMGANRCDEAQKMWILKQFLSKTVSWVFAGLFNIWKKVEY